MRAQLLSEVILPLLSMCPKGPINNRSSFSIGPELKECMQNIQYIQARQADIIRIIETQWEKDMDAVKTEMKRRDQVYNGFSENECQQHRLALGLDIIVQDIHFALKYKGFNCLQGLAMSALMMWKSDNFNNTSFTMIGICAKDDSERYMPGENHHVVGIVGLPAGIFETGDELSLGDLDQRCSKYPNAYAIDPWTCIDKNNPFKKVFPCTDMVMAFKAQVAAGEFKIRNFHGMAHLCRVICHIPNMGEAFDSLPKETQEDLRKSPQPQCLTECGAVIRAAIAKEKKETMQIMGRTLLSDAAYATYFGTHQADNEPEEAKGWCRRVSNCNVM